jgi:hypothetical protein
MNRQRCAATALLPVLLLTGLVGCGSGASGGSPSGDSASASGHSSAADADDQAVKFVNCLRRHGVHARSQGNGIAFPDIAQDKLNAAQSACRKYSPKGETDPNKVHDEDLKMARCLRRHGLDVKDPQSGRSLEFPRDADMQKITEAQQSCHKELTGSGARGDAR